MQIPAAFAFFSRFPFDSHRASPFRSFWVIEDELHDEQFGEFASLQNAWEELQRLSESPWDEPPNVAPCQGWKTCGRDYEILEYDTSVVPWHIVQRYAGLEVHAEGVEWGPDAPQHNKKSIQVDAAARNVVIRQRRYGLK